MKHEFGRSMVEMIMVLALIGILTIGAILAYQNGQNQNEANKIHELVSIASINGLTKMKEYDNSKIWGVIGKVDERAKGYYKCVTSLSVDKKGDVKITFSPDCNKVKNMLISQWGSHASGSGDTYTYTPPRDDE